MRAHVPSGIAGPMTIGRLIPARYTSAGSYTITVTASDPYGHAISANSTVEVAISAAPPPLVDNMFSVYCSGAFCGDVDAGTYSGQDAGIWRYHNSTSQTASVDVAIAGVSEGDLATLVFSNGQPLAAPEIPAVGTLVTGMTQSLRAPAAKFSPRAALSSTATSDMQILSRNQALARRLLAMRRAQSKLRAPVRAIARLAARSVAPAVGTMRVWSENFNTPVPYTMQVGATCPLVDGRNLVIWLDSSQVARGAVTNKEAENIAAKFCGPNATYPFQGTYARETAEFGYAYGPTSQYAGQFIQDGPDALQDINVVIPDAPTPASGLNWGGYFPAGDMFLKSAVPNSNEALSIFVRGYAAEDPNQQGPAVSSILVHELKHLLNFYQRTLVRGTSHATFLEETSAELAEDLFDESHARRDRFWSDLRRRRFSRWLLAPALRHRSRPRTDDRLQRQRRPRHELSMYRCHHPPARRQQL
jgi:hypothetical protein